MKFSDFYMKLNSNEIKIIYLHSKGLKKINKIKIIEKEDFVLKKSMTKIFYEYRPNYFLNLY